MIALYAFRLAGHSKITLLTDHIFYRLEGLDPCTQYSLQLRSQAEDGRVSADYTQLTVYTEHPEDVDLEHVANYTQVIKILLTTQQILHLYNKLLIVFSYTVL